MHSNAPIAALTIFSIFFMIRITFLISCRSVIDADQVQTHTVGSPNCTIQPLPLLYAPMHSVRYETVGRDAHRHGRVSCLLDVDIRQKKLFVRGAYCIVSYTLARHVLHFNHDCVENVLCSLLRRRANVYVCVCVCVCACVDSFVDVLEYRQYTRVFGSLASTSVSQVHLIEARGLATALDQPSDEGNLYVRTQLLPSKNPMLIHEVGNNACN